MSFDCSDVMMKVLWRMILLYEYTFFMLLTCSPSATFISPSFWCSAVLKLSFIYP